MEKTISLLNRVIDAKAPQVTPIRIYMVGFFAWAVSIFLVYLFLSEWFANNLGLYRQEQRWVLACSPGPSGCQGCCFPVLQTTYLFPGFAFYLAAIIAAVALPVALGVYHVRDRLFGMPKSSLFLILGVVLGVLGLFFYAFGLLHSNPVCGASRCYGNPDYAWGVPLEYAGMIVMIVGIGCLTLWRIGGHQAWKLGSSVTPRRSDSI